MSGKAVADKGQTWLAPRWQRMRRASQASSTAAGSKEGVCTLPPAKQPTCRMPSGMMRACGAPLMGSADKKRRKSCGHG